MEYDDFIKSKHIQSKTTGFDCNAFPDAMFPFQKAAVNFACRVGKAALFEDCGLGKTLQQLAWADAVCNHTSGRALILAPLLVAPQTVEEGRRFGIELEYARKPGNARITITNYEMMEHFNPDDYSAVVLDESSILKNFMGKTKQRLIEMFSRTPYRLACTATPAPNDYLELGNHAEFLGVMPSNEMISRWFINDTMSAGSYRLKRHAESSFWQWVSSWAVCIEKPSDVGFSDDGYDLPPLTVEMSIVDEEITPDDDSLFAGNKLSSSNRHKSQRQTAEARAAKCAEIARADSSRCIIWIDTNYEGDAMKSAIPESIEIRGNDSIEKKESRMKSFLDGDNPYLVTKASIAGFGVNLQCCNRIVYTGVTYSYEDFYQAVRRCWRFGQLNPVNVTVVCSSGESSIFAAIQRKMTDHQKMKRGMADAMKDWQITDRRMLSEVKNADESGENYHIMQGDCCQRIQDVADEVVGYTIFSPPFTNLYIYSDSIADMGNSADDEEFFKHFDYLIPQIHRVTMTGRLCSVHCKDLPMYMGRDGAAGLRDFPGEIIRRFSAHGWTFHSRCTIWKDPVIEMQRTKNHGLLYKNLCSDSSVSRQGMADYLLTFRKYGNGEFKNPVTANGERFARYVGLRPPDMRKSNPYHPDSDEYRRWSIEVWQRYASPVWDDIDQTDVLNYQLGREANDEKHICPLQVQVIERAIELWSNPGDVVFTPFMGIGSEVHTAIRCGRRGVGIELKESYFKQAHKSIAALESEMNEGSLF